MNLTNVKKLIRICIEKNIRINLAESCTGGLICSKIVSVANASKVFELGLVTYSNESKVKLLEIPNNILLKYGGVSEQTAYHMANGLAKFKNIDFSFAITGIAGPLGGTRNKPVGLIYFSFYLRNKEIIVDKKIFKGSRNQIREKASNYAIERSIEIIESKI